MGELDSISDINIFTVEWVSTLMDGIFAIDMTILVLNISIPVWSGIITEFTINNALIGILNHYIQFIISFFILVMILMGSHKQFSFIKKINKIYLWFNILFLIFIVTVPFSSSLNGVYAGFTLLV